MEAKEWRAWAVNFVNAKTRRIARLVMILGTNSLEKIFVYQSTLSMMRPLRYHQLRLARMNKPGEKDWRRPNNGNLKYGIIFLRKAKEAAHFDKK